MTTSCVGDWVGATFIRTEEIEICLMISVHFATDGTSTAANESEQHFYMWQLETQVHLKTQVYQRH